MEFTAPLSGAVLIYSPNTRQARLWPFGHRRFPSKSLSLSLIHNSAPTRLGMLSYAVYCFKKKRNGDLRVLLSAFRRQRLLCICDSFSPITRQARLWPFGHRRFPSMSLSPDNPLIQSPAGQRVDRSDIGALYRHVRSVLEHGHGEVIGVEEIDDRPVWHLQVSTAASFSLGPVTRYELWLDEARALPLLVRSYDKDDGMIEAVGRGGGRGGPGGPGGRGEGGG